MLQSFRACGRGVLPVLVGLVLFACGESTTPPVPAKLALTVGPSNTTADNLISLQVAIQDASGHTVTSSTAEVTVALGTNPGTATLGGDVTASAVNGVATFSDLAIQTAGVGYTLIASSSGLTAATSAPFNVVAGAAAKLQVLPIGASFKSMTLIDQVIVRVVDAHDNLVTSPSKQVTLALGANPAGGTMTAPSNSLSKPTSNGQTDFTGMAIDKIGSGYTLVASATGLQSGGTNTFEITTGDPAQLAWLDQPLASNPAGIIYPVFRVALQDAGGNLVTSSVGINVIMEAATSSSGGTVTAFPFGGQIKPPVQGIATFNTIRVDRPGTYTLRARTGNFSALSNQITVTQAFAKVAVGGGPTGSVVRAEDRHGCSLSTAGVLHCWGGSMTGALGVDNFDALALKLQPDLVYTDLLFKDVDAGMRHTCAVTTAGAAYCWGQNAFRQLGNGDATRETKLTPDPVAGGLHFVSISAGDQYTCGVTSSGPGVLSGPVYCWGWNGRGQLGDGTQDPRSAPTLVTGGLTFIAVSAGSEHTCGITTAFLTYCWGGNDRGQLGDASTNQRLDPTPVQNSATHEFRSISAGQFHTCAVRADNATYCWGANTNQQLGDGNTATTDRTAPSLVTSAFTSVSAGWLHTCGIGGGTVQCWGGNADGQLGDGGTTERNASAPVSGSLSFTQVSSGQDFSCGVTSDNRLYCWGRNDLGQLGDGSQAQRLAPVRVFP